MAYHSLVSAGWQGLDGIIDRLRRGDNVLWQVDGIEDYQRLVSPFVASALVANDRMVMALPATCRSLYLWGFQRLESTKTSFKKKIGRMKSMI